MNEALFVISQIVIFLSVFSLLFINRIRQMIVLLWIAGIFVGVNFLTLGAEYLAIVTWVAVTLTMISFQVSSAILKNTEHKKRKWITDAIFAGVVLLATIFAYVYCDEIQFLSKIEPISGSLSEVGRVISVKYPFVFLIAFLLLCLTPVGLGLLTREEAQR